MKSGDFQKELIILKNKYGSLLFTADDDGEQNVFRYLSIEEVEATSKLLNSFESQGLDENIVKKSVDSLYRNIYNLTFLISTSNDHEDEKIVLLGQHVYNNSYFDLEDIINKEKDIRSTFTIVEVLYPVIVSFIPYKIEELRKLSYIEFLKIFYMCLDFSKKTSKEVIGKLLHMMKGGRPPQEINNLNERDLDLIQEAKSALEKEKISPKNIDFEKDNEELNKFLSGN